jgi:hypothetical protein
MNQTEADREQQAIVDTFRQRAEQAAAQGQNEEARAWLEGVVELEIENVDAWLRLASLIPDARERMQCYAQVLQLDPGNRAAKVGLRQARRET